MIKRAVGFKMDLAALAVFDQQQKKPVQKMPENNDLSAIYITSRLTNPARNDIIKSTKYLAQCREKAFEINMDATE